MNDTTVDTVDQAVAHLAVALVGWWRTSPKRSESVTWRHPGGRWVIVAFTQGESFGLVRVTALDRAYRRHREQVLTDPEAAELPRLLKALGAPNVFVPRGTQHRESVEVAA